MMDPSVATYGEENRLWTGAEARAFARIGAIPELLAERAGRAAKVEPEGDGGGGAGPSPFPFSPFPVMARPPRLHLDRIASSTRNARLAPDVIVGDEIIA